MLTGSTSAAEAERLARQLNALSQRIEAIAIEPRGRPAVQVRDGRLDNPLHVHCDVRPGRWITLAPNRLRDLYAAELTNTEV